MSYCYVWDEELASCRSVGEVPSRERMQGRQSKLYCIISGQLGALSQ